MAVDQRALDSIALSRQEYDLIVDRLDREPNEVELEMFGTLWSAGTVARAGRTVLPARWTSSFHSSCLEFDGTSFSKA